MDHREPAWFDALRAEVDDAFVVTGVDTPGWPDPHPDLQRPLEEEYSRCLDPSKYRILHSRVDAWARVLASRDVARVQVELPPADAQWLNPRRPSDHFHEVTRITPTRPGGLALLLAGTLVDDAPYGLDVVVAGDDVMAVGVGSIPVCGCDACDDGSAALLEELDGWVLTIARGGVLHARLGESSATRMVNGWQGTGEWLDLAEPASPGMERWVGEPWIGGS